jgi:hypothetical protein
VTRMSFSLRHAATGTVVAAFEDAGMTKLGLCIAAVVASTVAASAQKAPGTSQASTSIGRAQNDDDRRMQGPIGMAKLVQDRSESEGEARERLHDGIMDADDDSERSLTASKLRDHGSRAAWMREDR